MTDNLGKRAACGHDGCGGVRLSVTRWCLAHAAERAPGAFEAELRRVGEGGPLDARGVVISAELLGRVLAAVPHEDEQAIFNGPVNFDGASFQGEARFDGVRFQGAVRFGETIFEGEARFDGARFRGPARFSGASFQGEAHFGRARFQGEARFGEVHFLGAAGFQEASFQDTARFGAARFHVVAGFRRASFQGSARFAWTRFDGPAWFDGASFQSEARFWQAEFAHTAGFRGTSFADEAAFNRAMFGRQAWFDDGDFQGEARFRDVSFQGTALFRKARFQAPARFVKASFQGDAGFDGADFIGKAEFDQACFQGETGFGRAAFHGEAGFRQATFQGTGDFGEATFAHAAHLGPLLARRLILDAAVFAARVQLEAVAAALCLRGTQFPAGVHLRLRYASVTLDDARISAPAILAGAPFPFRGLDEPEKRWQRMPPGPREQRWRPRLLSVCRADLAGLRLADVDLRACRFVGTPNLDQLRIEGAPLFARTAGWWRARRKTLAEEQHYRYVQLAGRRRSVGWYPRPCQPPASPDAEEPEVLEVLEPARLAALYRDLRKGREDAKDEPGAADFYYGECEMRRRDPGSPRAERLVLWAYWLLSGYALRAWRAVTALAVVVVLAGTLLAFWGFPSGPPSFRPTAVNPEGALVYQQQPSPPPPGIARLPEAIRFSARSATALLRGPDRPLTPLGEWLEISLRFAGPLLLGLAVLSVRGRVRR